ncbi:MAG: hypothetical protein ACFN41_11540 [Hallella multisaccharivorax]
MMEKKVEWKAVRRPTVNSIPAERATMGKWGRSLASTVPARAVSDRMTGMCRRRTFHGLRSAMISPVASAAIGG